MSVSRDVAAATMTVREEAGDMAHVYLLRSPAATTIITTARGHDEMMARQEQDSPEETASRAESRAKDVKSAARERQTTETRLKLT
jgi:hypothetical protein